MTDPRATAARDRTLRADLIAALVLAAVLSACWSIADWPRLSRLMLPDPDDMMRLQQVRDWIAGQGVNDWTQYRLAPPAGALMHWSRVNDVGIAAIILVATPLIGQHGAELAAVLIYPGALFAAAMLLSARIARRLWEPPAAPVAAVLTAVAYPGVTVFLPGRVDHHALQVVLTQSLVLLAMWRPTFRTGLAAGAVAAVSLVVGLEIAPQVAAVTATLVLVWIGGQAGACDRLAGFAAALAGVTLFFLLLLRPAFWSSLYCDAFTPASSAATLAGAVALSGLAALDRRLGTWQRRLVAATVLGGGALAAALLAYPACVNGPYGAVDPALRILYYPYITEAKGVFAQDGIAAALAVAGVVAAGCAASAWMIARAPRRWAETAPIASALWMSAIVMLAQVRGAYIGAPLATSILAGLIVAARRRDRGRTLAVAGAWLASAGLVYLEAPKIVERWVGGSPAATVVSVQAACMDGDPWAEIDHYPAGTVMAGTNVAAYLIGSTRHATIGAGYHRNNAANLAPYRFFLGRPELSRSIAQRWKVDYVLYCPGDFDELRPDRNFPHGLVVALRASHPPAWLEPLPLHHTSMRLYRIARPPLS